MDVTLCDVGPRDGLQTEAVAIPAATRAELCARLAATGVPLIEAVSFVRDELVPAMAEPEAVVAALDPAVVPRLAGLVLNERGYARLAATPLRAVRVTFGTTETFQQRNGGSSVEDGAARAAAVATAARVDGRSVTAVLSCSFGCPYEGEVDEGRVADLAARGALFADAVILADTIGVAGPSAVRRLVRRVLAAGVPVGVHLHDTRGTAVAGVLAALGEGAQLVDASVGGVGGCPFAPGAQGNVATEDLVLRPRARGGRDRDRPRRARGRRALAGRRARPPAPRSGAARRALAGDVAPAPYAASAATAGGSCSSAGRYCRQVSGTRGVASRMKSTGAGGRG
jgi:hydroxymethylglutaryl-CoA lyase/(R)-citramalyl-CoA lyase